MIIRAYQPTDEKQWVYTKALSYLFSPFFDDMETKKTEFDAEIYQASIQLVAEESGQLVGLLDIGIYNQEYSQGNMYAPGEKIAYFTNLAVHPDHQRQGIAGQLFKSAKEQLLALGVEALLIFTRESTTTESIYQKWGAELICTDYLVRGSLKEQAYPMMGLDQEKKRLTLTDRETGDRVPYMFREGLYYVAEEKDLELFDAEAVFYEHTFVLLLKGDNALDTAIAEKESGMSKAYDTVEKLMKDLLNED